MLLSGSVELIGGAGNRSPLTFGAEHGQDSIGIGEMLAVPPVPRHRKYGSICCGSNG